MKNKVVLRHPRPKFLICFIKKTPTKQQQEKKKRAEIEKIEIEDHSKKGQFQIKPSPCFSFPQYP